MPTAFEEDMISCILIDPIGDGDKIQCLGSTHHDVKVVDLTQSMVFVAIMRDGVIRWMFVGKEHTFCTI